MTTTRQYLSKVLVSLGALQATIRWTEQAVEAAKTTADYGAVVSELGALRTHLDNVERAAVDAMRADGQTWEQIGKLYGTTRQAAWERWGKS